MRYGQDTASSRRQLGKARRERGLSNVSVNKTLTLLRQVLSAGVRYGYIQSNPVEHVRRLKVAPCEAVPAARPGRAAGRGDRRGLPSAGANAPARGLRIGEALALRWRDVELLSDPPRLNIGRTWDPASKPDGAERRGLEGPVKTGEEGSVTIGRKLLETLLDHKEASAYDGDDDLVFSTSKGQHDNPSNIRARVLRPAITRANARLTLEKRPLIPAGLTPHSLRHTYCSLLIAQGEELSTVAAQMRHADLSTTLRVYAHVMKHRREGVAERLDDAIWGQNSGRNSVAKTAEPLAGVNGSKTASALHSGN